MKKRLKLIAAALLFLWSAVGCSSNEPAAAPSPLPTSRPAFPSGSFVQGDWSWDFHADGSFVTAGPLGTETGTYAARGDRVVLTCQCCGELQGTYTWSFDGAVLQLHVVDDPCASRREVLDGSTWTKAEG